MLCSLFFLFAPRGNQTKRRALAIKSIICNVEASNWGGYGDGLYVLLAAPAVQPQTNFFLLFVLALSAFPVVSPLFRSFALLLQLLQHGSLFSLARPVLIG